MQRSSIMEPRLPRRHPPCLQMVCGFPGRRVSVRHSETSVLTSCHCIAGSSGAPPRRLTKCAPESRCTWLTIQGSCVLPSFKLRLKTRTSILTFGRFSVALTSMTYQSVTARRERAAPNECPMWGCLRCTHSRHTPASRASLPALTAPQQYHSHSQKRYLNSFSIFPHHVLQTPIQHTLPSATPCRPPLPAARRCSRRSPYSSFAQCAVPLRSATTADGLAGVRPASKNQGLAMLAPW